MQRGTWIIAISGMMAFTQTGFADDPAANSSSGGSSAGTVRISAGTAPIRPVKKPATTIKPGNKNYYKDLFGEDDDTSTSTAKTKLPASAPSKSTGNDWDDDTPAVQPTKSLASAVKDALKDDDFSTDSDKAERGNPPSAPAAKSPVVRNKQKTDARVTQAIFDRPSGTKNAVQQVRGDGRPRSAPPISGFDDAAEKPAKTAAAKTRIARSTFEDEIPTAKASAEESSLTSERETVHVAPQTPQVTVEWVKRGEFNVGQECTVDLIVKNAGELAVSQVAIDAFFPTAVRLIGSEPQPATATDHLTWNFDELIPASEKRITLKLIPNSRDEIGAKAQVRFTGVSKASFAVSEPLLKVSIKSPAKEFMLADPISQMITLTNPGTGTAHDVKIEAKLTEGLEHPAHTDRLIIDVGSVGPGETRTIRLPLTAAKGGNQTVSVVATSSSDASSSDSVKFDIVAPSLKIAIEGPSLRYKGRNAKYSLTVTNDGSLVNNNIHISQAIADGFKFVSADHNGKFDPSVKTINWLVGHLEPGESAQVNCELHSLQIGEFTHNVQVVSDTGVQADGRIETRVEGIASLTMELVDLDDPVETGSETGYEIRVKNDGSKAATGVILACELPAGMEFLDAKSPVGQTIEGRQLTFKPIEQIAAGGQISFRLHTKVIRDGSHRLRVRLTGGGLQEPMVLEEVTRAYSDNSN